MGKNYNIQVEEMTCTDKGKIRVICVMAFLKRKPFFLMFLVTIKISIQRP